MTTPSGPISLAQEQLRQSLAQCAALQTWVGVAGLTGQDAIDRALESLWLEGLPPPSNDADDFTATQLNNYRPFVIINTGSENGLTMNLISIGAEGNEYDSSGQLFATFEQQVDPKITNDHAEVIRQFSNTIGDIIDNLTVLSGQGGQFTFHTLSVEYGPYRTDLNHVETFGDALQIQLRFGYGIGGGA